MRSTKVTLIAAAAAMLALTPTGASAAGHRHLRAHKHASPVGHCRIDLFAEPHQVTGGESVEVFGLLKCTGGASPAGQPVTIYARTAESNGFQEVGTATTDANGYYSFLAPSVSTDSLFYASAAGARSGERLVRVAPEVKLKGPEETKQLLTGRRSAVIFSGTVSPADAGATVILQRENAASSEEWHVIQRGLVSSSGEYSITHRFVVPGAANIRVVVRAHRKFSLRGISNSLSYDISQKENPRLTLDSSADPISYGQPVTLSGIVAGAVNQPVTLFARGRGATYAAVAKTTTNGSGEYSFAQMPLLSTFYRVSSGSVSSAVLFEGVKYVLTASASANTVQSGGAVVFSGTVTPTPLPVPPGHPVYLERENASGGGFHVVDVGTIQADSTYSISHTIYGSGKETFRVKVPGDPINQGIASSPFTIEVTPSAAARLKPEPPSKLPGEGQV